MYLMDRESQTTSEFGPANHNKAALTCGGISDGLLTLNNECAFATVPAYNALESDNGMATNAVGSVNV